MIEPADIVSLLETAKGERATWDPMYQDISDFIVPSRRFDLQKDGSLRSRNQIWNDTAVLANESLAAATHSLLVNPRTRWFEFMPLEDRDQSNEELLIWCYDTTTRVLEYLASKFSGFAVATHELMTDLCGFGTGINQWYEKKGFLRFMSRPLSTFWMRANDDGEIIQTFRTFEETQRDALVKFGDGLHPDTRKAIEESATKGDASKKIEFCHYVFERADRDPTRMDGANKPWGSIYVELAKKHIVGTQGGFDACPFFMPRWAKGSGEVYGRSPGMAVMATVKTLNIMERDSLMAGEQRVRPPMMVRAGTVEGSFSTLPGSIVYLKRGTREEKPEPLFTGADPFAGEKLMDRKEKRIEQAYFLDAWKLPDIDRMTAEEVMTRRQQGLLKSSPVLARLTGEWLDLAVGAVYGWQLRNRRLMPLPEKLANKPMKIRYTGAMARVQASTENEALSQAITRATPLLAADPTALMNVDTDAAVRGVFLKEGVDPRYLRRAKDVANMRKARAEQDQQAAQLAQAQGAAAAGKDAAAAAKDARDAQLI